MAIAKCLRVANCILVVTYTRDYLQPIKVFKVEDLLDEIFDTSAASNVTASGWRKMFPEF